MVIHWLPRSLLKFRRQPGSQTSRYRRKTISTVGISQLEALETRTLLSAVYPLPLISTIDTVAPIDRNAGEIGLPTADNIGLISPEEATIQSAAANQLIGLTTFRATADFAGVDGTGFSTVIIDTGINKTNYSYFGPDGNLDGVADRIIYSYDFSGSNDADATDTQGHGSNVASIAAGSKSDNLGMAPGAGIIALKVFPDGANTSAAASDIEEALQWVMTNGATYNIASVNLSLGSTVNLTDFRTSPYSDEIAALVSQNILVVCAAGNYYATFQTQGANNLSADPNMLAVGAVFDANIGAFSGGGGSKRIYSKYHGTEPNRSIFPKEQPTYSYFCSRSETAWGFSYLRW